MITRVDAAHSGALPDRPSVRSATRMPLARLVQPAMRAKPGAAHDLIGFACAHRNAARLRAGARMGVCVTGGAP